MMILLTRHQDDLGGNFDSVAWALETHCKMQDEGTYAFGILHGTEDSPDRIEFFVGRILVGAKPAWVWEPEAETKPAVMAIVREAQRHLRYSTAGPFFLNVDGLDVAISQESSFEDDGQMHAVFLCSTLDQRKTFLLASDGSRFFIRFANGSWASVEVRRFDHEES